LSLLKKNNPSTVIRRLKLAHRSLPPSRLPFPLPPFPPNVPMKEGRIQLKRHHQIQLLERMDQITLTHKRAPPIKIMRGSRVEQGELCVNTSKIRDIARPSPLPRQQQQQPPPTYDTSPPPSPPPTDQTHSSPPAPPTPSPASAPPWAAQTCQTQNYA